MAPRSDFSAVILAGGNSTRMGRNKLLLPLEQEPLVEIVLRKLKRIFADVLLITRSPADYEHLAVRIGEDLLATEARSPLAGIHAGLALAAHPRVFVLAGDMPLVEPRLVETIIAFADRGDIVVPYHDGLAEPLCAVYHRRCLPLIEQQLQMKRYRILDVFDRVQLFRIDEAVVRQVDPRLRSFANINTPGDYEALLAQADKL